MARVNVDHILTILKAHDVAYLVIGGMNVVLRHAGAMTYDVDVWIDDSPENRRRCEAALAEMNAEWGATDDDWGPVAKRAPGWLGAQGVYCLHSSIGAVDVFRSVAGLPSWAESRARAEAVATKAGTPYLRLCDEDVLRSQLALPPGEQKAERIALLRKAIEQQKPHGDAPTP
jgi:hypothetical protein